MTTNSFKDLLDQAKSASFDALPIGPYDVEVLDSQSTLSSTNKPMIRMTLRVLNGPHANRRVLTQLVLSVENSTALAMFFRNIRAFGLSDDYIVSLGGTENFPALAQALLGRKATATLSQREWPAGSGDMRNNVDNFKRLDGVIAGPPSPGGLPQAPIPTQHPGPQPGPQPGGDLSGLAQFGPAPQQPGQPGHPQDAMTGVPDPTSTTSSPVAGPPGPPVESSGAQTAEQNGQPTEHAAEQAAEPSETSQPPQQPQPQPTAPTASGPAF